MAKRNIIVITLAVVMPVVIGAIVALVIYGNNTAPFRATVLEINDTSISMRYFLRRLHLAGGTPTALFQTIANEEILKQVAPNPPYDIKISDDNVDQFLKEMARRDNNTMADDDFKLWFRRQLEITGLSETEFKGLILTNMLKQRMETYLQGEIPTVSEQVHLFMIAQNTVGDALRVKQRIDGGEDFYELARELNVDESLKEQGGDIGWYPRSALSETMARAAFDELEVGEISEPLSAGEQLTAIILVAEKAAARQIEERPLQIIKSRVLERWMQQEVQYHRIVIRGLNNGYDAETDAWIQWQLNKMREQ